MNCVSTPGHSVEVRKSSLIGNTAANAADSVPVIEHQSTVLEVECQPFSAADRDQQLRVFFRSLSELPERNGDFLAGRFTRGGAGPSPPGSG